MMPDKNNIVMSKKDLFENQKKAVKTGGTLSSVLETIPSGELLCVVMSSYKEPGDAIAVAVPEVWRPIDDRPINRRLAEYQLNSWFRRIHLGRLVEAGFPPPPPPPVEEDSDDELYD